MTVIGDIREITEDKELVVLNIGSGTRVDIVRGNISAIDLTLVSQSLDGVCSLRVFQHSTVGSDHCPVFISIGVDTEQR